MVEVRAELGPVDGAGLGAEQLDVEGPRRRPAHPARGPHRPVRGVVEGSRTRQGHPGLAQGSAHDRLEGVDVGGGDPDVERGAQAAADHGDSASAASSSKVWPSWYLGDTTTGPRTRAAQAMRSRIGEMSRWRASGAIRNASSSSGLLRFSTPSSTIMVHIVQLWAPEHRVGHWSPASLAARKMVWPSLTSRSMP